MKWFVPAGITLIKLRDSFVKDERDIFNNKKIFILWIQKLLDLDEKTEHAFYCLLFHIQ